MWDDLGNYMEWDADSTYNDPKAAAGTETNVLQTATQEPSAMSDSWGGFWQDTIKGVIGYAAARDMAEVRSQAQAQRQMTPAYRQAVTQQNNQSMLLPLLLIGGLVFLIKD